MDNGASSYRRFLDGDESGFDEILKLYHDSLIFFINRYVKNITVAEDLAADTFMEIIVHRKRYAFKSSFKTYLFSIAQHKAVDYVRHEMHYSRVPLDEIPEDTSDADAVERSVIASEEKRKIKALSEKLPIDYASYIHLAFFEELTNDEIAIVLKKSKKQTANIAYRAKNALKEAMRKEGIGNEKYE